MRTIKSFLVSGIALCVLCLIVYSTFFSTSIVDDTQAQDAKIYSPLTLSSSMAAQDSNIEEEEEDNAPPAEDSAPQATLEETPAQQPEPEAAPAPEPTPTPAPAPATNGQPSQPAVAPAAPAPASAPAPATNGQPVQAAAPAAQAPTNPAQTAALAAPAPTDPAQAAALAAPAPTDPAQAAATQVGQVPPAPVQTPPPPPPPVEEGKEELIGFDTIDLAEPSGNWLLKRNIWEKAQNKYEKIKGVFDRVLEARMPFFKRRAEIDRQTLDPLYISAGLDQEQIASILEEFNTLLTIDQEKNSTLDERAKKMQLAAMEDKRTLEQLKKDVADLDKYSKALDLFLDRLSEQVNLGRAAEKQAWQGYKDIGKELNDKKARELWLAMDTPFKRLTDIESYINGIFKQEFDKVCSTIEEHVNRIKDALQSLKEKGVDLKNFSKELDEKLQHDASPVCEVPQQEEQEGILGMITSWWNSFMDGIAGIYDSVMSYFTGVESEEVAEPKQEQPKKTDKKPVDKPATAQ